MRLSTVFLVIVALAAAIVPATGADPGGKLRVVTTLPDYAFFAGRIGGDRIDVQAIVGGDQDAHFIRPKPSFVTMVAEADVLVDTGLDLEMWLPTVIDKSGNTRVRSGQPGYISTSQGMHLLEKPQTISRIEGGVHLFGNPHVTVSPVLMKVAAENIATGLTRNDPEGRAVYAANLEALKAEIDRRLFGEELLGLLGSKALTKLGTNGELVPFVRKNSYRGRPLAEYAGGWLGKMLPLAGKPVVTFHTNWIYFFSLFGLEAAGTIEPKPGIPPSPKHVAELIETMKTRDVRLILAANYFDEHKVRSIAESVGAAPVVVPLYVGGAPGADDYFRLVDLWVDSLVRAARERGVIGDTR
jgi:ABC-type Zn uptake system ZnuABC Zn-binding protein ZnuA